MANEAISAIFIFFCWGHLLRFPKTKFQKDKNIYCPPVVHMQNFRFPKTKFQKDKNIYCPPVVHMQNF